MERRRTRAALTMSIIFTIYMLNAKHPAHQNNQSNPESVVRKVYQDDFEGYETGKTNLLTIHLQNISSSDWVLEMRKYRGQWKSEPDYVLRVRFPEFSDGFIRFSRNSTEIWTDSKPLRKVGALDFEFTVNEELSKLEGRIEVNGKYFLEFESKSVVRNDVYNTKLCYGLAVSLLYILSVGALIKHYKACLGNPAFAGQTSLLMLGLLLVYEFTFSMWQLHKAFNDRVNTGVDFVLIAAFWGFACFMLIYSKLMISVFESTINTQALVGEYGRSRLTSNFQSRSFFMIFFMFMVIILLSRLYFITVPLLHLFFVPQIVMNSIHGYKKSMSIVTVTIILLTKGFISGYFLLYEDNFIRYKPNLFMFVTITCFLGAQGLVLYWQRFKPRFLVPRKYRPMHYEYFRSKEEEAQFEGMDNTCNICMTPLNIGKSTEQVVNFSKTFHTPCNHKYHQDCLMHWLEIKMECPTCRSKLPPFEE